MRVAYLARHDQTYSNDDEGAITFALESLGHTVYRLREERAHVAHRMEGDFLLCHHIRDMVNLSRVKIPRVFWCFDLIDWPGDPTLAERCRRRREWVRSMTAVCHLGFLSDGDWVARDRTGKLVWLPQGADERVIGPGAFNEEPSGILFTGISRGGGRARESFVAEMRERCGEQFRHIEKGVYGRALADLIASAAIVVAPDSPVTDRYWSNRVWNTLGFGGFLLHPFCEELAGMYQDGREIVYYHSRDDLHELIAYHLEHPGPRQRIATAGLERTRRDHLYRHRVQRLIEVVKERLL